MLRSYFKLFPNFILKRIAARHCEVFLIQGKNYVQPFKGVLFEVEKKSIWVAK